MGMSKRLLEESEELEAIAMGVLIEADVIRSCELNEDCYMESGGRGDLTEAYRIANAKVSVGDISLPGDCTRRDMTDKIKKLGDSYWPETCARCAKDD